MSKQVVAIITCSLLFYSISSNSVTRKLEPGFLSYPCAGCHGVEGKGSGSIPSINKFKKTEFIQTLQNFRDGTRNSTVMSRIAKNYSDQELVTISGFFSKAD